MYIYIYISWRVLSTSEPLDDKHSAPDCIRVARWRDPDTLLLSVVIIVVVSYSYIFMSSVDVRFHSKTKKEKKRKRRKKKKRTHW